MGPGDYHKESGQNGPQLDSSPSSLKVITANGDLILEYVAGDSAATTSHKWQVASKLLASNSPYFQALLDPTKFSEGRQFNAQKEFWSETQIQDVASHHTLPTVTLPSVRPTNMCGEDAIELFLRILCLDSIGETERNVFEHELKVQPTSLIARMIDLADSFNSPRIVRNVLRRIGYAYGKAKPALFARFNAGLLSMREDRVRQTIFISTFLDDSRVSRLMTHTLAVVGSRFWTNGLEDPEEEDLRWKYLPNGIEGAYSSSFTRYQ
jgi:hypothetical protein